MTNKYQRPSGNYDGQVSLANRSKYQDDAASQPRVSISSSKIDGDFNYLVDKLNEIDEASGSRGSIAERLSQIMNEDGTVKSSLVAVLSDWVAIDTPIIERVDNSTVRLQGDWSGLFESDRRVRLSVGGVFLYASTSVVTFDGTYTLVDLVDVEDGNNTLQIISIDPTAFDYSPVTSGTKGNISSRFKHLKASDIVLDDTTIYIDLKGNGSHFRLTLGAGAFVIQENTGTEVSPVWATCLSCSSSALDVKKLCLTEQNSQIIFDYGQGVEGTLQSLGLSDFRTWTLPDSDGTLLTSESMNTVSNKTLVNPGFMSGSDPSQSFGFDYSDLPSGMPVSLSVPSVSGKLALLSQLGLVRQVVEVVAPSGLGEKYSNSNTWSGIAGMDLYITPSSANSKILMFFTCHNRIGDNDVDTIRNNHSIGSFRVLRDLVTSVFLGHGMSGQSGALNDKIGGLTSHIFIDEPNTTNEVHYRVQMRQHQGTGAFVVSDTNTVDSQTHAHRRMIAIELGGIS